jgi:hypothetical protein
MKKCFLLFLAVFFWVFGCSKMAGKYEGGVAEFSNSRARSPGLGYEDSAPVYKGVSNLYGNMADENTGSTAAASGANATESEFMAENIERKIVRHANVRVRVENLETAEISINDLMEKYGAYAASTSADENSRRYTIRVPSAVYKDFLAGTAVMGKVINRSESADDVTLRYYDLEGRLDTNKELLKTFQSYLGKAKNIEEILSVERRIAELQSEIDSTGKDLRRLANDVDYSTVELTVLGPAALVLYQYPTLPDRMKELFGGFGNFLSVLAVILIGIVVYGVPIALLLLFFIWLLFGKIGLFKKLWRLAVNKKPHE